MKKHLHLGPARIAAFENCELAFKYDQDHEGEKMSSPPLRIGSAVHLCAEQYIIHCVESKQQTDLAEMDKIVIRNRRGLKSDKEKKEVKELCRRFAENFIVPEDSNSETQLAFDRSWKLCEWDSDRVYFRCRPDLWYVPEPGTVSIIDFTTARKVPSDIYDTGKAEQLFMYGFAILQSGLVEEINELRLSILNIRYNINNSVLVYPGELDYIKDVVGETYSKILVASRTGKWVHSIGDTCDFCNHFRYCEAITESLHRMYDAEFGDIVEVVDTMMAHGATSKRMEKLLRSHVEHHGNIIMQDGSEFGEYLKRGKSYVARRVMNTIIRKSPGDKKAKNIDEALQEFSVSAQSVKKLIKKLELPKQDFVSCRVDANKNMFGTVPKGNDPFGDI